MWGTYKGRWLLGVECNTLVEWLCVRAPACGICAALHNPFLNHGVPADRSMMLPTSEPCLTARFTSCMTACVTARAPPFGHVLAVFHQALTAFDHFAPRRVRWARARSRRRTRWALCHDTSSTRDAQTGAVGQAAHILVQSCLQWSHLVSCWTDQGA